MLQRTINQAVSTQSQQINLQATLIKSTCCKQIVIYSMPTRAVSPAPHRAPATVHKPAGKRVAQTSEYILRNPWHFAQLRTAHRTRPSRYVCAYSLLLGVGQPAIAPVAQQTPPPGMRACAGCFSRVLASTTSASAHIAHAKIAAKADGKRHISHRALMQRRCPLSARGIIPNRKSSAGNLALCKALCHEKAG